MIALPPRDVLRKTLALPAALEENLRQALGYDLDRHTPFKADELYFDAAVVDRNPARGTITRRPRGGATHVVDPALKHVAAWGAEVAAVVPEPPATAAQSRLNLLPPELRAARAAAGAAGSSGCRSRCSRSSPLAAVRSRSGRSANTRQRAATRADQARARAAISETLRTELDARVGDYNFALERKYAFPGRSRRWSTR